MEAEKFRQEMPPKGGYGGIIFERIPLKKPWSGFKLFSVWAVVTTASFYVYGLNQRYVRRTMRENDELIVALEPLLLAERDRMYLNQLRKNREEEVDLMKNVPGWKVGTLYGEPLYKTIGEDRLMDPHQYEYYAHAHPYARPYMYFYDCLY